MSWHKSGILTSLSLAMCLGCFSDAHAYEHLEHVSSKTYATDSSTEQMIPIAAQCLIQSDVNTNKAFTEYAPDKGILAIQTDSNYSDMSQRYEIKSILTFSVRNGRYSMLHSAIRYTNRGRATYSPVIKEWGTGWQAAESALESISTRIAKCISQQRVIHLSTITAE